MILKQVSIIFDSKVKSLALRQGSLRCSSRVAVSKFDFTWNSMLLKNVNNCLNTNIYSFLETFSGQSSNLNLNIVHLFNTSVNRIVNIRHQCRKTAVLSCHSCLIKTGVEKLYLNID